MATYKKYILLFVSVIIVAAVSAQEDFLRPQLGDTSTIEFQKQIEYRQLISGKLMTDLNSPKSMFPAYNLTDEFDNRYSFSFNLFDMGFVKYNSFALSSFDYSFSPFSNHGFVLSEGSYKFGNKFSVGGYSYGVNSIMSAPLPQPGMSNFDRYGSTMFMQYKVGKNFKIETRVNVSRGYSPVP